MLRLQKVCALFTPFGNSLGFAVSIEAEDDRIDQLLSELEGKNIEEVIASGVSKLASVPSGGGGGGAAAGGGGGAAAAGLCSCATSNIVCTAVLQFLLQAL